MLYYALVFLVVGLIAGVLGATGVAAIASQIAWIFFIIGVILLISPSRHRPERARRVVVPGTSTAFCARGALRGRPRAGPPTVLHHSPRSRFWFLLFQVLVFIV